MSEEGLIALLALAGIAYVAWIVGAFFKGISNQQKWNRKQAQAHAVQQGVKPIGKPLGHSYGSAYFLSPAQVREKGLGFSADEFFERRRTGELGFLFLGEWSYSERGDKRSMDTAVPVLEGPGHVLTIAPTRSGKGTCAVIPNLLNYDGSVIVNDIKGENYAVTSAWRRAIDHDVHKFAPFERDSASWNPFDILHESDTPWEDARLMAELLIPETNEKDPFWKNGARNLLTGLILYIAEEEPFDNQNLSHLRDLLTQDQEELELTLAKMAAYENKTIFRAANTFQRADIKVRSGILSTLDSELGFLDSEQLAACTADSDFSFADIKVDKTSIFFILPPERLRTYAPFMRLFFGMAALELKREKHKPQWPVLLMMDEFPAMGRMKVIEEEISFLAGYDVRLWLFAQDLGQLAAIYGEKAQSIIANCKVKQFFGVADMETAKLVSAMCGNTTVPSISVSANTGANVDTSSVSIGDAQQPLYDPTEVMNLDDYLQLLFFQGHRPVIAQKINYLTAGALFEYNGKKLYSPNPYHS